MESRRFAYCTYRYSKGSESSLPQNHLQSSKNSYNFVVPIPPFFELHNEGTHMLSKHFKLLTNENIYQKTICLFTKLPRIIVARHFSLTEFIQTQKG